jgi:ATP-binding cassette subfamily B protein
MRFLKIYGRVLGLLRSHLRTAIALGVSNIALAGFHFLDPVLFGRVIDLLSNSASLPTEQLWAQAGVLLAVWGAVGLASIGLGMTVALFADRLAHRKRREEMAHYYSHVMTLPPSFHTRTHSGQLMKVMGAGTESLFGLWLGFYREQLSTIVSALILLPLTLFLNWRLALALMVLVAVFTSLTAFAITHTEERQRHAERFHTRLASTIGDVLANLPVVQSFARLAQERARFDGLYDKIIMHQFPVLNWWAFVSMLTRTSSTIAVMAIVTVGTWLHARGQAGVGEVVSFMGFAALLVSRLEALTWFAARLFSAVPNLEEYFAVRDASSTLVEPADAPALRPGPGEVRFRDVGFSYPGSAITLDSISFTARSASVVALVGQTGAGKTTAMNLLQRMWDPQSGAIEIDGQDIRAVTLQSLRESIGVVFQESMLLARTIRENLLIGRPDATQAEIEACCRQAEAHDFILRQPQGYDTIVGERGATLSGGQRQRLAIARALLKDPPILILDEATSALDAATEARVSRALRALMAGRTTFIIAHRLSTVRDADEILVFDQGRIVERGTFSALLQQGGCFAELVASQLAPPEPELLLAAAE